MDLSAEFEEPAACVICLEEFLPPPPDTSALGVGQDIDTDVKNKNKTISKAVEEVPTKDNGVATDESANLPNMLLEVASLSGCNHIYHDKCIKEWSSVTNSEYILPWDAYEY